MNKNFRSVTDNHHQLWFQALPGIPCLGGSCQLWFQALPGIPCLGGSCLPIRKGGASRTSRSKAGALERGFRTLLSVVIICLLICHPVNGRPPNIVLIMADDLGTETLECYGGLSYRTPQLNQLAKEGLRFTHAYSQPLCTNTRIQLMTGIYNHRNWIAFGILDPSAKTIGHYMSEAGYKTCIAGKWQLQSYDPPDYPGAEKRRGIGMRVDKAGFDEYCLWHTGHTERKGSRYADPVINQNGQFLSDTKGKYGPDIWVDFIRDFMSKHRSEPFFVYYPMALPHWPFVKTPDSQTWADRTKRHDEDLTHFRDMVEYTDKVVGQVVKSVDDLGLGESTLILFYSDNGTHLKITSNTTTGPVAGGKGLTNDAGTRVPMMARWPGKVPVGVHSDLIDSTDFLPTILEAAENPISKNLSIPIDGRSFYPQLLGKKGHPRDWIFCHYDPRPGWDKDKFQLLRFAKDKRYKLYDDGRLFDVEYDRLEKHPIAHDTASAIAKQARAKLQKVLDLQNTRNK